MILGQFLHNWCINEELFEIYENMLMMQPLK